MENISKATKEENVGNVEDSNITEIKPRPYQNIYPQKLPELQLKDEPMDFTGLNLKEKKTLELVWRKVKPNLKHLSMNMYLSIFTKHEELLEKFRSEDKLMVGQIGKHSSGSSATFSAIMENIYNPRKLEMILRNLVKVHFDAGIKRKDFEIYLNYVIETVLRIFEKHKSPTLVNSLEKLKEFILHGFEVKRYRVSLMYQ